MNNQEQKTLSWLAEHFQEVSEKFSHHPSLQTFLFDQAFDLPEPETPIEIQKAILEDQLKASLANQQQLFFTLLVPCMVNVPVEQYYDFSTLDKYSPVHVKLAELLEDLDLPFSTDKPKKKGRKAQKVQIKLSNNYLSLLRFKVSAAFLLVESNLCQYLDFLFEAARAPKGSNKRISLGVRKANYFRSVKEEHGLDLEAEMNLLLGTVKQLGWEIPESW